MSQSARLPKGGLIDRSRPLPFTFDGHALSGFAGDTVASALLANNVHLVGRSFKLHRPRGFVGAGYEDAGIMVHRLTPRPATNQLATTHALEAGLRLTSVNAWPSASFDTGAVAQAFSRLLPAGFYYKTFMTPGWSWFESSVRNRAGLGHVPGNDAWEPTSESRHGHCDILVAGAGPAGLAAALVAARSGARVMLVDDGLGFGGRLVNDGTMVNGKPATAWVEAVIAELRACPEVRVLQRSTVWSYLEHNYLAVLERAPSDAPGLDFRNWKIRARQVIIATGAIERPLAFTDNDRPGIMLASAVRSYIHRHAVLPGREAVVFTNTDAGHATALDLARAGAAVSLVDCRTAPDAALQEVTRAQGIRCHVGAQIQRAFGSRHVRGVEVVDSAGRSARIACDLVATSGGWNPAIHLASHTRQAQVDWSSSLHAFVARPLASTFRLAGAANGHYDTTACLRDGVDAAHVALKATGHAVAPMDLPSLKPQATGVGSPLWAVPPRAKRDQVFVDFSGDVTTADLGLAVREGFDSIELVKRYTTAGMGVDQGKTGNTNVIGLMGDLTQSAPSSVGTTTFRPPFVPVEFGAIAGARSGARFTPWRHTPLTEWHMAHGAAMVESGLRWQRPGYYARPGETWLQAATREARAVREGTGVYDSTPLGKFQLKGPGVPALLDLLYTNDFSALKPGLGKYGVMLTDDGLILDDGVTFRLDDNHWLLHSSTGAAERVHQHIEMLLNVHRPDLAVSLIPVTSAWATATVCGPRSRDLLRALGPDFDISAEAFPFMAVREGTLGTFPVRVFRVSWTGELSFEINTAPRYAVRMWEQIMRLGAPLGIAPVGSEASHILRVEAGYLSTGHEVDGTSDPYDLGHGAMVSKTKNDFIGKRSMELRRRLDPVRPELVGLLPDDPARTVPDGAPLTRGGQRTDQEGFVSACVASVACQRSVALGLLRNGRARMGETVHARVHDEIIPMRVVAPVFHDAERKRVKS
ncbi:MAG: FAD-dependent oxidoreductase [Burkholderiaceae bacterium]